MTGPVRVPQWSAEARAACVGEYRKIAGLPFLRALADGTLPREAFLLYLRQDALYLEAYARAMRQLAGRLPEGPDRDLFVHFADDGVSAEREMQETFDTETRGTDPSPACSRCIGHVRRMASEAPVPVALAGVLPCFTVYAEAGEMLRSAFGGDIPPAHPYARWIGAYSGDGFAADAAAASAVCDRYATRFPSECPAMSTAYREGVLLEHAFWAEAY